MKFLTTSVNSVLFFVALSFLVGCNEEVASGLIIKESEIKAGIDQQLPINGMVNVKIHIPDDVASLNGLFSHRVIEDPMVDAKIVLNDVDVTLLGPKDALPGRVKLIAKPTVQITLLGAAVDEALNIEIQGGLRAEGNKLFLTDIHVVDQGSFFLNNLVPEKYKEQFITNLKDWFVAYFSAYPLIQPKQGDRLVAYQFDTMTWVIEDDLVRFTD